MTVAIRSPHGNVVGASHFQPNNQQRPTPYAVERKIESPDHDCRDHNQVSQRLDYQRFNIQRGRNRRRRPINEAPTATWWEIHIFNLTISSAQRHTRSSGKLNLQTMVAETAIKPAGDWIANASTSNEGRNRRRRPTKEAPTATWREIHIFNLTISSAQTTCAVERKIGFPEHGCRDRNQVGRRLDANCARSPSRSTANEIQATKFVVRGSLL